MMREANYLEKNIYIIHLIYGMLCVCARYFIGWIRKFICMFFELSSSGKGDIQNYGDTDMHERCY